MKNVKVLAWSLLIILALLWGSSFILIKRGLTVYGPGELGAIRIIAAFLFLLPLALPRIKTLSYRHIRLLFSIGMVGSFIPAFLFALGQTKLDSGITGVLNGLTPVSVLIIGALFFAQKITRDKLTGLLLAFAGTVVLLIAGSDGDLAKVNYYVFFIVLATICYGINVNVIKFYISDLNPVVITSVSLFFVGPLAIIYLFTATDFTVKLTTAGGALPALGYIVLLGVMSTAIALILFNKLIQITTPIFSSTVTYLIPIVALAWGLMDGEKLIPGQMIGIAAVFFGVFITNRKP